MINIPDWIIKYDEANYQSSAGIAIRELIKIINELENSSNSNNKPLVKGAVSGRSEQLKAFAEFCEDNYSFEIPDRIIKDYEQSL